ncbi:MAG: hypothetical protein MUC58_14560 [Rhizobiaceae bacterium]|jgi:hypothetical protein|nr:hypothetical protein [Rhizobiaceae bacterium]
MADAATTHELIAMAAQKRVAQAKLNTRRTLNCLKTVGPAHIRAALMFTARKVN